MNAILKNINKILDERLKLKRNKVLFLNILTTFKRIRNKK